MHMCDTQVHVEHREDADLATGLRLAEAAVEKELGYKIALLEKPLYDPTAAIDGTEDNNDGHEGADDETMAIAESDDERPPAKRRAAM